MGDMGKQWQEFTKILRTPSSIGDFLSVSDGEIGRLSLVAGPAFDELLVELGEAKSPKNREKISKRIGLVGIFIPTTAMMEMKSVEERVAVMRKRFDEYKAA
jgi:hypothetical protein